MKSYRSTFRMIARSVGYRLGKASVENKSEWMPNLSELFDPEYVPDAEAGYDEGQAFVRAKLAGRSVDTFYQGGSRHELSIHRDAKSGGSQTLYG